LSRSRRSAGGADGDAVGLLEDAVGLLEEEVDRDAEVLVEEEGGGGKLSVGRLEEELDEVQAVQTETL
jgi:hypothetical protein